MGLLLCLFLIYFCIQKGAKARKKKLQRDDSMGVFFFLTKILGELSP
jgi:hypothetical protein